MEMLVVLPNACSCTTGMVSHYYLICYSKYIVSTLFEYCIFGIIINYIDRCTWSRMTKYLINK